MQTIKIVYKNIEVKYRDGLVKKYKDKVGMGHVQEWPCPTSTNHIHIHIPQGCFSIPHKIVLKAAYIACMAPTDEGLATVASIMVCTTTPRCLLFKASHWVLLSLNSWLLAVYQLANITHHCGRIKRKERNTKDYQFWAGGKSVLKHIWHFTSIQMQILL